MTIDEFSNGFDVAIDSYRRFRGLDAAEMTDTLDFNEYEKSVFLTRAQENIVKSLYSGKNQNGDSFEISEEMRRSLDSLVKTARIDEFSTSNAIDGVVASLPKDIMYIVYEKAKPKSDCPDATLDVVATTHDEYNVVKRNSFRGSSKRVLRLDSGDSNVELVSDIPLAVYIIRYLSRPDPIVLADLPEGVSVDGQSKKQGCKLNPLLHNYILSDSITLALQSRGFATDRPSKK